MPSKAAQQRQVEKDRQDLGPFISVTVEGTDYLLASRDMTGLDVRAMRDQCGHGFATLLSLALTDMDVDILAEVVWMARRINGEPQLTYDEVAGAMKRQTDWEFKTPDVFNVADAGDGGDDEHPEG